VPSSLQSVFNSDSKTLRQLGGKNLVQPRLIEIPVDLLLYINHEDPF
jgi:hypothetical protein